jgi:hypothetical protein
MYDCHFSGRSSSAVAETGNWYAGTQSMHSTVNEELVNLFEPQVFVLRVLFRMDAVHWAGIHKLYP